MRKVNFLGHDVSRLIVGDNPFTGHSYIEHIISGKEMKDYYDSKHLYNELWKIEEAGFTCMMPLAESFNIRILAEYKRDGGKMNFIFQPNDVLEFNVALREMATVEPIGIYHQGTNTDCAYEAGDVAPVKKLMDDFRKGLGIPVGLGSHYPNVIELAEREEWGADFYVTCLHNARRGREGKKSGFLTGETKQGLVFYAEDRPVMLDVISKVSKPCIAFKIFAGGQMLLDEDHDKVRATIKNVYKEVYSKIKPSDIAAIGVFSKYHDQITEDAELFEEAMAELEAEA